MKILHLMRHAKAVDDRGQKDSDRALTDRGIRAATLVGLYLQQHKIHPGLVLCSTALRTRQTYDCLKSYLGGAPVRFEESLYMADQDDIGQVLSLAPEETKEILLIGHNPGLHLFAAAKAKQSDDKPTDRLYEGFPTAAIATLKFAKGDWADIGGRMQGELQRFLRPEDLV